MTTAAQPQTQVWVNDHGVLMGGELVELVNRTQAPGVVRIRLYAYRCFWYHAGWVQWGAAGRHWPARPERGAHFSRASALEDAVQNAKKILEDASAGCPDAFEVSKALAARVQPRLFERQYQLEPPRE